MAEKRDDSKPSKSGRLNEGATKSNTKPISEGPKTTPPPPKPPAPPKKD